MSTWTRELDLRASASAARLAAGDPPELVVHWRAFVMAIAAPLEAWVARNRVLRRCRLAGEDDVRTVLVDVLERLAADDYRNLRAYAARREPLCDAPDAPGAEADLVGAVVRIGKLDEADDANDDPTGSIAAASDGDTPLRAWLLALVSYAARDHVRRRFGWSLATGALTKRDLHSDAARLDQVAEPPVLPGMTDRLTVSRLCAEVDAQISTFPEAMRETVTLWLADHDPDEIARRVGLADGAQARALIRAGQARLRERFRGRSSLLFA